MVKIHFPNRSSLSAGCSSSANWSGASAALSLVIALILLVSATGCTLLTGSSDSLQQTQTAIAIQQTDLATKASGDLAATITAQQATINAQSARQTELALPPTPDLAATQVAISVQQTMAASGGAAPPPPSPGSPSTPPPGDFEAWMKSANILLYEDIVNEPDLARFVRDTLNAYDFTFKDDGSAKGWLKSDLLGGANGQPWDLVILSLEARGEVSGEYFEYINDVLNQGSSVIIEGWHLDEINMGKIKPILVRCGVDVYPYFPKTNTAIDMVLYPLVIPHPVLSEPNSGMSFTNVIDTWMWMGDLGSLMYLTGTGDAQLLLGTNAQEKAQDGALAVCMGGQLTLQTFSSHTFTYDTMMLLWHNYIYNALKVRYAKR